MTNKHNKSFDYDLANDSFIAGLITFLAGLLLIILAIIL